MSVAGIAGIAEIAEPTTLATDWLVAATSTAFAWRQLARRRRTGAPTLWWPATFAAVAATALLGGTWHGFAPALGEAWADRLWAAAMVAAGAVGFGLLASAVADECSARARRVVLALATAKYALFLAWAVPRAEYLGVVIDSAVSLGAALAVHARGWLSRRSARAPWVLAGVSVSLTAAAVQASGVSLHRHLNHNDLYHLIQLPGLWLFHRAALAPTRPLQSEHAGRRANA